MSECLICTRIHNDAYACPQCVTTLTSDLRTLAYLADELETTRTRQARVAGQTGGGNGTPLGFHLGAAQTADALHHTLAAWVRVWTGGWVPKGTPADLAWWIAGHELQHLVHIDQLAEDVRVHTAVALAVINPLPDEQTYGVCGAELDDGGTCAAHLYGAPGADWVRCRKCQTQHDTKVRTRQLEARARVLYFRAATLARILPRFIDRPVSASGIRNWVQRGKPIRTQDENGFLTYHCGDVIQVALTTPERDRKKEAS